MINRIFVVFIGMTLGLWFVLSCFKRIDDRGMVIPVPEEMEIEIR